MSRTTALLRDINDRAIAGAMALLPAAMDSEAARVMLLTIGLQESEFLHRQQIIEKRAPVTRQIILSPTGPAKSFWGAEKTGGMVIGVRTHKASAGLAAKVYQARGVDPDDADIWDAVKTDDILAAALARLLLFTDPRKLPATNATSEAYAMYLWNWRPGKQRPATWPSHHATAREFLGVA